MSDCFDCKKKVIEVADLIEQLNEIIEKTNPNFLDDVAPEFAEEVEKEEREKRERGEKEKENEPVIEEVSKQKFKINKYSYLAAASIIIIIISISLFTLLSKQSNKQLFNDFFTPYPDIITEKGEANDNLLENAMYYYNSGNYMMVVEMLDSRIDNNATDYLLSFYFGISCLKTNKTDEAIEAFRNIIVNNRKPIIYQSTWYLALGYLKNNETEKAINSLEVLSELETSYAEKAEDLLKELK